MTHNIINRANNAMMNGRTFDSYNLPEQLKREISARHYTQEEINMWYAKSRQKDQSSD